MKTIKEVWELVETKGIEGAATEMGVSVEWVRAMMDTDAWEYLGGKDGV